MDLDGGVSSATNEVSGLALLSEADGGNGSLSVHEEDLGARVSVAPSEPPPVPANYTSTLPPAANVTEKELTTVEDVGKELNDTHSPFVPANYTLSIPSTSNVTEEELTTIENVGPELNATHPPEPHTPGSSPTTLTPAPPSAGPAPPHSGPVMPGPRKTEPTSEISECRLRSLVGRGSESECYFSSVPFHFTLV